MATRGQLVFWNLSKLFYDIRSSTGQLVFEILEHLPQSVRHIRSNEI